MTDEDSKLISDEAETTEASDAAIDDPGQDATEDAVLEDGAIEDGDAGDDDSSGGESKDFMDSETDADDAPAMDWYILKVAFNREDSIADALRKRIKMEGMEEFFGDVVVPTEDVATFTRDGKRRITKRKLLPGYIMARMIINDDTWFLVRETGGISDFTGSAGKPMPMDPADIERFVNRPEVDDDDEPAPIKTAIPFKVGDRVRVKEGNFENQEGDVDTVDEANGRITVIINIFGRSVPMELDHWQVEPL
ncbi:transcription termination/antitermination protein NusG [Stieleria varia]|uniref:Transcription termination/antitermination protein NusG n=1 Tax=Stieleria varia TaxID=2528005 RepID=A0A5C6ARC6_9BACT|nr:transcription termination/antitermination protein NusG [Stieleria varia]TWU02583.1 hypothetical protein Pla52n_36330 [Stieleria varia]